MLRIATFVLLAAVDIGGGFGSASAEVLFLSEESMEVEVQVEVQNSVDAVVVHFALSGEDSVTLPLVSRGDGVFGITTELKPANYQVIFETLGDPPIQSLPVTLTDLGAHIGGSSGSATSTTEGLSDVTQGWGWLALAFGAASLAALAFWALGGGGKDDEDEGPEPESKETAVEPDEWVADDQPSSGPPPDS